MSQDDFRIDRSYFSLADMAEPDDAKAYWLTKSPQERVAAMEFLRLSLYGYKPATTPTSKSSWDCWTQDKLDIWWTEDTQSGGFLPSESKYSRAFREWPSKSVMLRVLPLNSMEPRLQSSACLLSSETKRQRDVRRTWQILRSFP